MSYFSEAPCRPLSLPHHWSKVGGACLRCGRGFWTQDGCSLTPPSLVTLKLRRPGSEEDRFKTPGLRYLDAKTWVGENERACESCGFPTFVRAYGPAVYHRSLLEDGARTPGPFKPAGGVDRHVCHDCLTMATGFKVGDIAHV